MKRFLFLITALLLSAPIAALAQDIPVNGEAENGYGGVYEINGSNYWWMCAEPTGSPAAAFTQSFIAEARSFQDGWVAQNTERANYFYDADPLVQQARLDVAAKQVAVMSYVLDTYLPWGSAGASGRFIEEYQNDFGASFDDNNTFYNSLFAVQGFIAEMYGKEGQDDFTNLDNFVDRWIDAGDVAPGSAGEARSALFQSILDDIELLDDTDPNFFANYEALHGYFMANTSYPDGDINNWQDALIIQSFAPVPEPSGALLIGCFGIVVLLRRCRRAAAPAFDA